MKVGLLVLNKFTHDARVLKTARFLYREGNQVTVIALKSAGVPLTEDMEGMTVLRPRLLTISWPKHTIFQAIKYAEWVIKACRVAKRMDVLHCNDLNTFPVGALMKLLTWGRVKVVYDAHEFESNQVRFQSRRSIAMLQLIEGL